MRITHATQTQLLHVVVHSVTSVSLSTKGLMQNPCSPLNTVMIRCPSPLHFQLFHFKTWFFMPAGAAYSYHTQAQPTDAAYGNIALFIMDYGYFFRARWLLVVPGAVGIY